MVTRNSKCWFFFFRKTNCTFSSWINSNCHIGRNLWSANTFSAHQMGNMGCIHTLTDKNSYSCLNIFLNYLIAEKPSFSAGFKILSVRNMYHTQFQSLSTHLLCLFSLPSPPLDFTHYCFTQKCFMFEELPISFSSLTFPLYIHLLLSFIPLPAFVSPLICAPSLSLLVSLSLPSCHPVRHLFLPGSRQQCLSLL